MKPEDEPADRWFLLSRLNNGAVMVALPTGAVRTLSREEYAQLVAEAEKVAWQRATKSQPL